MLKIFDPVVVAAIVTGVGAGVGAVIDLRTRRVPNVLTGSIAALGLLLAVLHATPVSPVAALGGLAVGLAIMLPAHLIGATGAGDVKLLAAAGALLGPALTFRAFVGTVIAGGVIALVVAVHRGRLRRTLDATRRLAVGNAAADEIEDPKAGNRFAYAPAIAIGATLAALGW